jgi:hypothetical protein
VPSTLLARADEVIDNGLAATQQFGRFSNRPFWVKRLSDYPPL